MHLRILGESEKDILFPMLSNKPVIPLEQRMQMLRALRCVDIVIPYYDLEYVSGCRTVAADIFVVGEDWGTKAHNLAVEAYLLDQGSEIVKVQYDLRTSSTQIKQTVMAQPARKLAVAV